MMSSRFCSRCHKDLTDAASMECGVGPICRKLDNALLAKLIPSNVALAKHFFSKINLINLMTPVCVHTVAMVGNALEKDCDDWRETVKRTEWVLSHPLADEDRAALMGMVGALGYVGIVSMWLGEAASGKADVAYVSGRLWIKGPRVKAGATALKAIMGRKFHPKTPTTPACWSVPASGWEAFHTAVITHWPNHEGLADAIAAAKAEASTGVVVATTPVVSKPVATITVEGDNLVVATPYNGGFVAALKTLPYKDRKWNPANKTWSVKVTHKDAVDKMVADFFGVKVAA